MDNSPNSPSYDVVIENLSVGMPPTRTTWTSLWSGRRSQNVTFCDLVLRDVNARICSGEVMAVLGSSGSGKTTLLHAIVSRLAGLPIIQGQVLITPSESPSSGQTARSLGTTVGFVGQHDYLLPNLTGTVYQWHLCMHR